MSLIESADVPDRNVRLSEWISRALWDLVLVSALWSAMLIIRLYVNELAYREWPEISAPQLAAEMSLYLALAVIPYVVARAWDGIFRPRGR